MAARFSQQFLDELLARVDLVDLIDGRVPLKRSGSNYKACCPFHSEKTPSFSVNRAKQFYYCFGCGAHGNAIDFLRAYERLDFPEAVAHLAESVGMSLPAPDGAAAGLQESGAAKRLHELQSRVARFYRHQLRTHPEAPHAIDYLKRRGITGDIAQRYGLGYAPPGWHTLAAEFDIQELEDAGLLIRRSGSSYDRFRNRIMFPIRDRRGRVVGFGGRVLDDTQPKYLNSPETPVFRKHEHVYGLFEALEASARIERLVVVEGYMDVIALAQFGFPYAVATLGTSASPEHLSLMFRFTEELVFCFDGDTAGRKAAWKALQTALPVLPEGGVVRFLALPQGEDPDSLIRKEGSEAFRTRVAGSRLLSDYFFAELSRSLSLDSIEGRTALIRRASPLLQTMKPGPFRQMMRTRLEELTRPAASSPRPARIPRPPIAASETPGLSAQNRLLMLLLHQPELIRLLDQTAQSCLAEDETSGALFRRFFAALQQQPDLPAERIPDVFHGMPEEPLIDRLRAMECAVAGDALETEFRDTVACIHRQFLERRLDELIGRARDGQLDRDETAEMRRLIAKARVND